MQCPTDGSTLVMSERSGIEIDYCPDCRGIWLDRGELDKLIERSFTEPAPSGDASWQQPQQPGYGQQQPGYGQQPPGYGQQQGHGQQSGTAATVGKIADQVMRQVQQRTSGQRGQQGHGAQGSGQQGRRSWLGDILR